jgi:hypothetical protein
MFNTLIQLWCTFFVCPKKGHAPRPNSRDALWTRFAKEGEWYCSRCGKPVPVGQPAPELP